MRWAASSPGSQWSLPGRRAGPLGITANSFASVSLAPPLGALVAGAQRFPAFEAAPHFAIHVLSAGQRAGGAFLAAGDGFAEVEFAPGYGRTPLLAGCVARFECRHAAGHPGGDHLIVVGEVLRVEQADLPPLIYHRGAYCGLGGCFCPSAALRGRRAPEPEPRTVMAKDKANKPRRPRAETLKGFRDYFGAEVRARTAMLARICEVYHAWGFDPLETSAVETVEALGKFLPDVDRPNEGSSPGRTRTMVAGAALRPDGAAGAGVRAAPDEPACALSGLSGGAGGATRSRGRGGSGSSTSAMPIRWVPPAWLRTPRCAPCWARRLRRRGSRGRTTIRINNRKVLNGIMEVAGVLDPADPEAQAARRGIVMRAIDKIDRLGEGAARCSGPGGGTRAGTSPPARGWGEEQAG